MTLHDLSMAARLSRPWEVMSRRIGRTIDEATWRTAEEGGRIRFDLTDRLPYYRFARNVGSIPRGTVLLPEGVVWDFPRLPRILHLEHGLARWMKEPFRVEEKVDGYNVRIVRAGERTLAFTRSGQVCPFATDRLPDFPSFEGLLDARPDLVVSAEVVGPGSPYNTVPPPWIDDDVSIVAFDVGLLGERRHLPPLERSRIFETHDVPEVRSFGVLSPGEIETARRIVERVDAEGGEGVVFKATSGGTRFKYACLGTHVRDLRATVGLVGGVQRAAIVNHLVGFALAVHEHRAGGGEAERQALGTAVLDALLASIRQASGGAIEERYEVRMHDDENVDRLLATIMASSGIQVRVERRERGPDGYVRVVFHRRHLRPTGYFKKRLEGGSFVD